jgi:hypothetical protein
VKGISKYGDEVRKNNTPVVTEVQGIKSSTPPGLDYTDGTIKYIGIIKIM